ncbi:ABC-2 type transport system ATP-binding protein, partial [Lachnobacterium bovis DSM 14045]
MNKEAILQVKNVSKKYKNEMALENVSFNLTSGKVVGLVGPNGA